MAEGTQRLCRLVGELETGQEIMAQEDIVRPEFIGKGEAHEEEVKAIDIPDR